MLVKFGEIFDQAFNYRLDILYCGFWEQRTYTILYIWNIIKATHPVEWSCFSINFFGFFGKISTIKMERLFIYSPANFLVAYPES